ncbi:MAG: RNA pyrophosphohydrolase, partial [Lysobacteraceae bacterium]
MIDPDGYRPNVAIVLMHPDGRVFWARRVRRDGWQFPQGGMNSDETPTEAMYRELREETGLLPEHVDVIGSTPGWLRYRLPPRAVRRNDRMVCIGQKQVWFLLRFTGSESDLKLDLTETPEFDHWRWVDFWYPIEHVVNFKRSVYAHALHHLAPYARQVAGEAIPPLGGDSMRWMRPRGRRGGAGRAPPGRGAGPRGGGWPRGAHPPPP